MSKVQGLNPIYIGDESEDLLFVATRTRIPKLRELGKARAEKMKPRGSRAAPILSLNSLRIAPGDPPC